MSYDYYPKPSKPRRTNEGIKAKSKRGDFVKNWWAGRWISTLEGLVNPGRLSRGKTYARKGQVLSVEENKGEITAKVQGSRARPYKVSLKVSPLTEAQWARVIEVMAEQALFTAQLLAGEMPQDIETAFAAAGTSLFPADAAELTTRCSCPDPENPCKHIAAVHYLLGERFDEDPFLLFRLRGRSQEEIMSALQARRGAAPAADEAEPGPTIEAAPPLAASLDSFWELGQPLAQFNTTIKPPAVDLPVLKRLGQPSFLNEDIFELLGPAYRGVTDQAVAAAFEDEPAGPED